MDVPDENEDLEALRGMKRCLSFDNLHKDIVPPQKNGNSYFANRDITASIGHIPIRDQGGHSETGVGDESGHSELSCHPEGLKDAWNLTMLAHIPQKETGVMDHIQPLMVC